LSDFIVQTEKLRKYYQSPQGIIKAIDDLSIEVPKGAIALLGPNGSGKSTLIKMILGLIIPTSGKFTLFNNEKTNSGRNRFGYMPETPSIITKVNAVKFVRHFGQLSGLNFTRAMQRSHEVLDYVGLGEERYRPIDKYSTGMKQRLLFAQTLVHDPDVIILDEPTTGLSPEGREEMLNLILEINREYGKSIVFSTHILPDIESICTYTLILNKGDCIFQGELADIKKMYPETLQLQVSSNQQAIAANLQQDGYQISVNERYVSILKNQKQLPSFSEISTLVKQNNSTILAINRHQPNLEDLFLNLINRDIDQE
jgi:ABC-2 type transport system ATP-binding protein